MFGFTTPFIVFGCIPVFLSATIFAISRSTVEPDDDSIAGAEANVPSENISIWTVLNRSICSCLLCVLIIIMIIYSLQPTLTLFMQVDVHIDVAVSGVLFSFFGGIYNC